MSFCCFFSSAHCRVTMGTKPTPNGIHNGSRTPSFRGLHLSLLYVGQITRAFIDPGGTNSLQHPLPFNLGRWIGYGWMKWKGFCWSNRLFWLKRRACAKGKWLVGTGDEKGPTETVPWIQISENRLEIFLLIINELSDLSLKVSVVIAIEDFQLTVNQVGL